jgi:hypothetical protein
MRRRKAEAAQKCASADCWEATYWGLDLRTYLERKNKLSLCKYSDVEKKIVNETGLKKWRDLPSVLRLEACIRDKMLEP